MYVYDPTAATDDFDKLEEVVFKNEKIGLAMKAFDAVKMVVTDAETDPLLRDEGREVPRLMVVDPLKERIKVLEKNQLKVSALYGAMKSVANRFYKEKIDKLVKTHLKLLTERDQVSNEEKVLRDKEGRLASEGDKAKRNLEKVRKELEEVRKELEELATRERELWKLTPKHQPA